MRQEDWFQNLEVDETQVFKPGWLQNLNQGSAGRQSLRLEWSQNCYYLEMYVNELREMELRCLILHGLYGSQVQ